MNWNALERRSRAQSFPTGHGPRAPGVVQVLDLSDLTDPQRRFVRLLKSSSEHMLNLARAATKDYQGLNEKIAPVSVKSLTA